MRCPAPRTLPLLVLLLALAACQATAQDDAPKPDAPGPASEDDGDGDEAADADDEDDEDDDEEDDQESWDEALEDLKRVAGLFTLHHGESKLLLELDAASLGREFLYYAALESGAGSDDVYRGAMLWETETVLRFERRGDEKVALVARNLRYVDPGDTREQAMLAEVTSEGVLRSFDVEAELEDEGRLLVDLGSWFLADNLELADVAPGDDYEVDGDLSLFDAVAAWPRNVEIDQELVLTEGEDGNLTQADPGSLVLKVRHSLCALPEDGYTPRPFDQRVGYFYTDRKDLFDVDSVDPVRRFVNRWRLVKKDPTADVSEPVQPIVFWIEDSTPKRWRDAVRAGIVAWEPAFRKAGFANGIVAKQMPADAAWEPADVRYSVVRWSADEDLGFAIGPSRVDPRTGEIFDADITMQESFVRAYGVRFDDLVEGVRGRSKEELRDERRRARERRSSPPDAAELLRCRLAGEERREQAARAMALAEALQPDFDREAFLRAMVTEVVAHEVGHALGLRHNFKASTWRPAAELGDAAQTAKHGLVGSVMDYNPINLAAPGEPQGEFFASVPGPYDLWAIEYGYAEIEGSNVEGALAAIAARSPEPGLDFGTDEDLIVGDALCQVWDLGADPLDFAEQQIALAEAGLAKLREKGAKDGEGYHRYSRWYAMFARHYRRSYEDLGRFLGGWTLNRDLVGQEGGRPPIEPIDVVMQQRALDLLCDRGLAWTGGIPDADRLLLANPKFGPFGSWFGYWAMEQVTEAVNMARYWILLDLLDGGLYTRLGTQSRLAEGTGLDPHAVATRVFERVWSETPDEHDRWTQVDFVALVTGELGYDYPPDVRALFEILLDRCGERAATYTTAADPVIAAHGRSLGERIRRYRERQLVEF